MKIISIILIYSLFFLEMNCCSTIPIKQQAEIKEVLHKGSLDYTLSAIGERHKISESEGITVIDKENKEYFFDSGMYRFEFATLYGVAS